MKLSLGSSQFVLLAPSLQFVNITIFVIQMQITLLYIGQTFVTIYIKIISLTLIA